MITTLTVTVDVEDNGTVISVDEQAFHADDAVYQKKVRLVSIFSGTPMDTALDTIADIVRERARTALFAGGSVAAAVTGRLQ
jgi:hypothetical protein